MYHVGTMRLRVRWRCFPFIQSKTFSLPGSTWSVVFVNIYFLCQDPSRQLYKFPADCCSKLWTAPWPLCLWKLEIDFFFFFQIPLRETKNETERIRHQLTSGESSDETKTKRRFWNDLLTAGFLFWGTESCVKVQLILGIVEIYWEKRRLGKMLRLLWRFVVSGCGVRMFACVDPMCSPDPHLVLVCPGILALHNSNKQGENETTERKFDRQQHQGTQVSFSFGRALRFSQWKFCCIVLNFFN